MLKIVLALVICLIPFGLMAYLLISSFFHIRKGKRDIKAAEKRMMDAIKDLNE